MPDDREFKLSLPARGENLARVRRALSEFAASVGADDDLVADLRLAVNEACTNVVRHAYTAGEGGMQVEARPVGGYLVVVVHDSGQGLGTPSTDPGAGFGLEVAKALTDSMEIFERERGTEVRMRFTLGAAA
jgi:serine/threonine-protein kinase RsbW